MAALLLVTAGPPVLAAASAAMGQTSTEVFLDEHLPDRDLVRVVSVRDEDPETFEVLLLGDLTVARYPRRVTTRRPDGPPADWSVPFVAMDHWTAPADVDAASLDLVARADRRGRYALYRTAPAP